MASNSNQHNNNNNNNKWVQQLPRLLVDGEVPECHAGLLGRHRFCCLVACLVVLLRTSLPFCDAVSGVPVRWTPNRGVRVGKNAYWEEVSSGGVRWHRVPYGGFCFACDHGKHRNAKRYICCGVTSLRGAKQQSQLHPKPYRLATTSSLHNFITTK